MEIFFDGEFYHLYIRGKNKEDLFFEEKDYLRMMSLINTCNKINSGPLSKILRKNNLENLSVYKPTPNCYVEMVSFVLMPNHFHLMFKSLFPRASGYFIKRILNSYSKYFNKKYSNIGHAFESKYKFKHVKTQAQFDVLISYIKNNPIKLLDPNYKHSDLLNGNYKIKPEIKIFLENYPYFWQHPTLTDLFT